MQLSLDFEQLWLKSEHLHADPGRAHYHEDDENPLLVSWSDRVTVLYPLGGLTEASLWNPVEPVILPTINPVISVLTFDSKVYCIDEIGSVHHLKQLQRDSPELFDSSLPSHVSQQPLSIDYEWKVLYSQCPCNILGATYYSDGIALIAILGEWITMQLLRITINDDSDEPIILNTCNKQIRPVKQFPFLVTSFISCVWRDWFNSQRSRELFDPNALDGKDVFIIGTEESKVYCATSDVISKNGSLFLDCPQKIVHIQFSNFESRRLLLVSSSGILTVINCIENTPLSLIYLAVTKVVSVYVVDNTVIVSDGVHLVQITLDKQFSEVVKQVVSPLTGVFSLQKFQFSKVIAMTQLNKVYKISPKYKMITQGTELKFKFNENSALEDIKNLYKDIESLEEQHGKLDKYIDAVSIIARKNLVALCCSFDVLIYSDAKAMKLGARQDEYIVAIKLSTNCSWLSFPSKIWQLLVRVIDSENTTSDCELHSFDIDAFDSCHPLVIKHRVSAAIIKNCSSGSVCCELMCQIKNDFTNRCLVVPLCPIKLNALYFVKAEKREKIAVINPLENRHKYVFKFPEHLTLAECLTVLMNKNKHRTSKSLLTNIMDNMPKTLYMNFFGNIVSIILDDKTTKSIVIECIDQDALIVVRNGILDELSNNQPAIINYSVLADVQKQLCSLEELSMKEQHNKNFVKQVITEIQNQISINLPI